MEDPDTLKKGMVTILYNVGLESSGKSYTDILMRAALIKNSLPYRSVATHYCFNNEKIRAAMSLMQLVVGKDNRVRFRGHFGAFSMKGRISI